MPEPGDICQGEMNTGSVTIPTDRCILQAAKLERWSHQSHLKLKSQTPNMEPGFDVCDAGFLFWFGLVPRVLTMALFFPFGMRFCILCHCMLEVCNLLFLILEGLSFKRLR